MKKIVRGLVWGLVCIAAGSIALIGAVVELIFSIMRKIRYVFMLGVVTLLNKVNNTDRYYIRKCNHAISELANEDIRNASKIRQLKF